MNTNGRFARVRLAMVLGVTVIAFSLMRTPVAHAETASEFVSKLGESAIELLVDESRSREARVKEFYSLLEEGFDLPLIGRFVLGVHWRQSSTEQRAEYTELFQQYLINTYASRLGRYGGETLRIKGERADGNGKDTIVSSEILQQKGPTIKLDWRVRRTAGVHKVVDIIVEGISLVITQRDEFASVIRREGAGVEGLLAQLRGRTVAQNLSAR